MFRELIINFVDRIKIFVYFTKSYFINLLNYVYYKIIPNYSPKYYFIFQNLKSVSLNKINKKINQKSIDPQ